MESETDTAAADSPEGLKALKEVFGTPDKPSKDREAEEQWWMTVVKAGKEKQVFMSPSKIDAAQGIANLIATAATESAKHLPGRLTITLFQGTLEGQDWKSDMKPHFKADLRIYRR